MNESAGKSGNSIQSALLGGALFLLAATLCPAQAPATRSAEPPDISWWREARFGLFVHWGPVSLKGTEIGWSRGGERRGRSGTGAIPVEVYDNLYKEFDPVEFDADEWVAMAREAGMQYLVFTTKHHDGFAMFDSALTDYKITNSPFKRDIVAELARACQKAGLKLGFYHSQPDWYHPDYRTERHERYIAYLHGQVRELCTRYGKVDVLWFDGLGGKPGDWEAEKLLAMIRKLQPGILINNRAGLPADFDTPEQRIGRFDRERPWESCITICRQWAWKPDDRLKPLKECLEILVKCVGGDGNLLLNVGPMPSGAIEPRQVERLREIGAWLKKYGESIYGTRGGPYLPGAWGASTHRKNKVFLHVLQWSDEGPLVLPAPPRRIVASSLLTGGELALKETADGLEVAVPASARHELDTIIVLELDGPLDDFKPLRVPSSSLSAFKKATASNVYQKRTAYGPDRALDDDRTTRWATDTAVTAAWLEVDLGQERTFVRAQLSEAYGRVRRFELQRRHAGQWIAFHRGTTIGEDLQIEFAPVSARLVRLQILEAQGGPTIREFGLYPPRN